VTTEPERVGRAGNAQHQGHQSNAMKIHL
jgi:hypothetical protein